jgi:hypothetical protein
VTKEEGRRAAMGVFQDKGAERRGAVGGGEARRRPRVVAVKALVVLPAMKRVVGVTGVRVGRSAWPKPWVGVSCRVGGRRGIGYLEPGAFTVNDADGETWEVPFVKGREDVLLKVGRERARVLASVVMMG